MNTAVARQLFTYDPVRTHAELDHVRAEKFLDDLNFPEAARRVIFDVFARSFFNDPGDMSAAELVKMFHLYFLGSWESICFDVLDEPFDVAVWQPLSRLLETLGTHILTSTTVSELSKRSGKWHANGINDEFDAVVLALSLPGLQTLAAASPDLVDDGWRENISTLPSAPPFSVLRLWLDRRVDSNRPAFLGTSGIGICDNISIVDAYQGEARRWSYSANGSIVELHAYALSETKRNPSEVRADLITTLHRLYPETASAVITDERHLIRQDCPGFPPGLHSRRPTVQTSDPTVVVAGDLVRLPFPAALMEAAVSSGRIAANALLETQQVSGDPVYSIPLRGVGASAVSWWRRNSKRGAPTTSP
jgi:isorenieratene synthase